jgi:hypothetical protein
MSAVTATLLGAVLGGMIGLAGSLIGLFGPRYFRTRGEIRLRTSRWEADQDPTAYTYKLSIYMFNEMEIDTAVQDVQVLLGKHRDDSEPLVSTPTEAVEPYYRLDSVALPSRASINRDVVGKIATDILTENFGDSSEEMSIKWVWLKGVWPTGKEFLHKVITDGTVNDRSTNYKYKQIF